MSLNKKEKTELVVKLHQENKTVRQIAEIVHMSFKDIAAITKRMDGRSIDDDIDLGNKSKTTQAIYMFNNGKKPIDVAVELDLSASEVQNILEEFWALNELHELVFVYHEIRTYLPSFLKLFHCLKNNKMLSEKHIINVLKYVGNDLPQLTDRVQCLSNDVINLEDKKRNLLDKLIVWSAQLSDLDRSIDIRNQQLKRMGN